MTTTTRTGPWVPNLGSFDTLANLQIAYPGASQQPGVTAFCADSGLMWSDGTSWRTMYVGGLNSVQYVSSGGSATVSSGVDTIILDGVNTTFALTFPVPLGDGQLLCVQTATAISVAFTTVATAPATTIKTTPGTTVAGQGVGWIYKISSTTWFRLY